jgi:hypothetical protein
MIVVGLYLLSVTAGLPLLALWLIGRAVLGDNSADAGVTARLVIQLVLLGLVWFLARRFLPPFRWRA